MDRKKILLVDDSSTVLLMERMILSKHEYDVALLAWDDLPRADAIVAAVPHRSFRVLPVDDFVAKVAANGLFIDVKGQADAAALRARGIQVWRL